MAVARVDRLSFSYTGTGPALRDVSLTVAPGEAVLLLGPSGSGKSTLIRALAGLVPHFHGGRFAGRVVIDGLDTRRVRPAELAGVVATLFQDPEDQVVMTRVDSEVAFGLQNVGTPPAAIPGRVLEALAAAGVAHLSGRVTYELSSGELQRVCLASVLALRPRLLLLDEPTSQLDRAAADELVAGALALGAAVVVSDQRPERLLDSVDRVVFVDEGRIAFDGDVAAARAWLARERPEWVSEPVPPAGAAAGEAVVTLAGIGFAFGRRPVLEAIDLDVRRGEVVAVDGPNGSGKTTLARIAAGLLAPAAGTVRVAGRAAYLSQDPGRYVVCERADDEVALAIGGDRMRAVRWLDAVGLARLADRHPRDLSSGERERLALAAVLAVEPDLLVLDEPTRGVDPERKAELVQLLRSNAHRGGTLVVTHDEAFAAAVADRTVSLGRERVRA